MANDYNRAVRASAESAAGYYDAGLRSYMLRVYNYMIIGLGLTGVTAWIVANVAPVRALFYTVHQTAYGLTYGLSMLGWVALIAPIGLVMLLSFRINRMSLGAAQLAFWGYASLVGISLAPILLLYTGASVAEVFFITAATFGAMSLYGYTTGRNLTGLGSFLFMGLIGIMLAMVVNIFLHSAAMQFVISVIGVLIFTGLTAYDTQAIKETYSANSDGSLQKRAAIMGALRLYLDFINLFIMLMQLMGQRR